MSNFILFVRVNNEKTGEFIQRPCAVYSIPDAQARYRKEISKSWVRNAVENGGEILKGHIYDIDGKCLQAEITGSKVNIFIKDSDDDSGFTSDVFTSDVKELDKAEQEHSVYQSPAFIA